MKRKIKIFAAVLAAQMLLPLLLISALVLMLGPPEEGEERIDDLTWIRGGAFSDDVLKHRPMVEKYCKEFGISDHVLSILAIMQVESGGKGGDVMQSSESLGMKAGTLDTEASIKQGCKYFSELLDTAEANGNDLNAVYQAYNYGGGFLKYLIFNGRFYSFERAEAYSKEKSNGKKVTYKNAIAVAENGGWRYSYGNMFYVRLVHQYLTWESDSSGVFQTVMMEALKYQGWPYVFGGDNPNRGFDCSGLVQWCYRKAGITLPRGALAQHQASTPVSEENLRAGDLVFFEKTYSAPKPGATHVGIYVGDGKMYDSNSKGIMFSDLNSKYWKSHLLGYGRVIN